MKSASNDTQKRDEKNRKKRFVRKRQMSLSSRKTLESVDFTGLFESVVADWLQKGVASLLPE